VILPTKHVSPSRSLLGLGALVVTHLDRPCTVSALWERVRGLPEIATFERFVLALDLVYIMGVVDIEDGVLRRQPR
jgi:hypothetical protein